MDQAVPMPVEGRMSPGSQGRESSAKHRLNADSARDILSVLDSATFTTFIEEWITKEQTYQMQQSLHTFSLDDRGVDMSVKCIGRANGLQLCAQRITSLRKLCQSIITQEVENLKKSGNGGPTDATISGRR